MTIYGVQYIDCFEANKEIFPLNGDSSQVRDFTFVEDVVEANRLAAFTDVSSGLVFNVGGGSSVLMNETITKIMHICAWRSFSHRHILQTDRVFIEEM